MIKMKICGFQKTTLLDYPGHVAATIFLGLCNFRCPFCHNGELLTEDAEELFSTEEVLEVLKKEPLCWKACASPAENPPFRQTWSC